MSSPNRPVRSLYCLVVVLFVLSMLVQSTKVQALDLPNPQQQVVINRHYFPIMFKSEPSKWLNGPYGGSVVALAIDPKNNNIVYGGSLGGGVFKSTDGGSTWKNASNGLGWLNHDSLAVDPVDTNIIYAGTHGYGVNKSLDGGKNWFEVNEGIYPDSVVYTLAVSPGNHNLVYAGTRRKNSLDGTLYKTKDGGAHWEAVLQTQNDWVYSVAVNPGSPDNLLAAVHEAGVYRAGDYGGRDDWYATNNGICDGVCQKGRNVAFDPRSWVKRAFYTAWHGDMFKSTDNGSSWSYSENGLGNSYIYPNGIAFNPENNDNIYLASWKSDVAGVMKSYDSGSHWQGAGLYGKIIYTVAVPKGSSDTVLAGTFQDGLYRSTNGGSNWSPSSVGIVNTQVTGVVLTNPSTIYSSTHGSGIQRSRDGGQTWSNFSNGLSDQFINGLVLHPAKPNILFALTNQSGLRKIDLNAGSSWSAVLNAPVESTAVITESLIASRQLRQEPIDEMLKLDGEPLLETPQLNQELNQVAINSLSAPALSMAFAPSNAQIAYVGTSGSGVYRSADGGSTWASAGLSDSGQQIISLAVDPSDPNRVYAATRKYDGNDNITASNIKKSTNGGQSWVDISPPGLIISEVAVSPFLRNSFVAATNYGVWKYNGSAWSSLGLKEFNIRTAVASPFSAGLFYIATDTSVYSIYMDGETRIIAMESPYPLSVQSINIDPSDPYHLYVGSVNRGILRAAIPPWMIRK